MQAAVIFCYKLHVVQVTMSVLFSPEHNSYLRLFGLHRQLTSTDEISSMGEKRRLQFFQKDGDNTCEYAE
jgi:hypothetical protein